MRTKASDSFNELSYYELFDVAEKARWEMTALSWDKFDATKVDESLITLVKHMTIGECTTFSATRSFMDLFAEDLDFTQWLAVWFYEETKHPQALTKWLALAKVKITEQELLDARKITPMTESQVEMLTFNIVSEIVAAALYNTYARDVKEPLLQEIMTWLGKDETRHSVGFEHYCKAYIAVSDNPQQERLRALRAAWAFMQDDSFVEHPVYITLNRVKYAFNDNFMEKTKRQIATRIGKAIGIPTLSCENFNATYQALRREFRQISIPPAQQNRALDA
jgi:hypothetical protein